MGDFAGVVLVLLAQDGVTGSIRCNDPARPDVARDPLLPGHIELDVAGARHGEDAAEGGPGDVVRIDANCAAVRSEAERTMLKRIVSPERGPGPGRA